jgi:hypothetical protein
MLARLRRLDLVMAYPNPARSVLPGHWTSSRIFGAHVVVGRVTSRGAPLAVVKAVPRKPHVHRAEQKLSNATRQLLICVCEES